MTQHISKAFDSFIEACGLAHISKEATQIIEMKRAFFAGNVWMFSQLTSDVLDEHNGEEQMIEHMNNLQNEFENFLAGIEDGHV